MSLYSAGRCEVNARQLDDALDWNTDERTTCQYLPSVSAKCMFFFYRVNMVLQAPCIHAGRSWDESTTATVFSSGPQWSSLTRLNIQLTLKTQITPNQRKYLAFCLQHQQKMFSFSFILKLMHAVPSTCLETATRLPRVGFRGGHKHLPEGVTNLGEVLVHRVRVWAFQKSGASKRKFFLISGGFIDSPETYIIG